MADGNDETTRGPFPCLQKVQLDGAETGLPRRAGVRPWGWLVPGLMRHGALHRAWHTGHAMYTHSELGNLQGCPAPTPCLPSIV